MKKKQKRPVSSDDDVEPNFTLFTERRKTEAHDRPKRTEGEEPEREREESEGEESEISEEGDVEESDKEVEGANEEVESEQEGEESNEEEAGSEEVEDEGGEELRTREDVQKELSHMSFQDVLKLQNKVGTKVYNRVKHDDDGGSRTEPSTSCKRKRLNKNRPMEVSAKRPVTFLRQVVSVKKTTLRDPRFDDLSGEYKADIFEKTYGFINDIKRREKEVIKKKMKKTKSEKKKEELQFLVKRMENQERATLSREQQRNRELEFKRQQRQRANQGEAPLFLNNSERKKLQLLEKYQDLKRSGKLENFLTKKRKRNATKDRKKLPPQPHTNAPRGFH